MHDVLHDAGTAGLFMIRSMPEHARLDSAQVSWFLAVFVDAVCFKLMIAQAELTVSRAQT